MLKLPTLILLAFSSISLAVTNWNDFAPIANGWKDTHGIAELDAFCQDWLDYDPNAVDGSAGVVLNTLTEIQLDCNGTCEQYIIDSEPNGTLYDIFSVNPTTGASKFAEVRSVPHIIKHADNKIYYYTTSDANDSFNFKAANIKDSRESSPASMTITTSSNDKDSLFFDRAATVEIPDTNAVDFDESFTFACWFKPMARHGSILEKRTDSAGVKISLRAKHLVVEAWNSSGQYGKVICEDYVYQLFLDSWHFLAVTKDVSDPNNDLVYLDAFVYPASDLPTPPYTNDVNVLVCDRYLGQVDKLTWFDAKDDFSVAFFFSEGRTVYGGVFAPTDYLAQFRCDEGTGTIITDFVSGTLTGTINNAAWVPDDRPKRRNINR